MILFNVSGVSADVPHLFFMQESPKACEWFLAQAPQYKPQKINSLQKCHTHVFFSQQVPSIVYLNGRQLEKILLTKKMSKTKLMDLPEDINPEDENLNITMDDDGNFAFQILDPESEIDTPIPTSKKYESLKTKLSKALCCDLTKKLKLKDEALDDIMKTMATDPAFEELENEGESIELIPLAAPKKGLLVRTLLNESSHFHQPVFMCENNCTTYQRIELGDLKNLGIHAHKSGHFFIGQEGTNSSPRIFTLESTKPIKEFPKAKFSTWLNQN